MLRIQFLSAKLGPFVVETDDPIGINELTKTIKRSADHDGIIFEVIFDLEFIKQARHYLKSAFETDGGIDAVVLVNIYKDNPNTRKWVLYSEGTVNFNKYDLYEDKLTINIEQTGMQRRVTNLMDTDVDLETLVSENGTALPVPNILTALPLHSKTIIKVSSVEPGQLVETQMPNVFDQVVPALTAPYRERIVFGQMDTTNAKIDELPEAFKTPFGARDFGVGMGLTGPATQEQTRDWLLAHGDLYALFNVQAFNEAGIVDLDLCVKAINEIEATNSGGDVDVIGESCLGFVEIYYWLELRNINNAVKFLTFLGAATMEAGGADINTGAPVNLTHTIAALNVERGDKLYWFYTVRIQGEYDNDTVLSGTVSHHFRITPQEGYFLKLNSKTSAPESTSKAVLLYEAFQRCLQYYTNDNDCFYSGLVGRVDIQQPGADIGTTYPIDGEGALIVWTNGGNLRGLPDKPIFANLTDLIEFVNSIYCVGFGFETFADGKQRFRLEKRSYFYNKNNKILSLGAVYNIRKSIDSKRYYNQIEFGYASKIDIGQTNAIDAFNTKRRNSIPVVNTKNQLKIATKVKADGYQIEQARRLAFQTTDGKNDDEPFVIVVIREGETFRSKKDEGYDLIENVFDSPTGYNYDISPARTYRNWFKIIAAALIYAKTKVIKFTYGEVNFLMRTQKTGETFIVEENGDVDLQGVEPDYDNFIYHLMDVDISDDLVQAICDNPYGYIEFEDRFGQVMGGYISDQGIEHDSNKGKASFQLLKVFRP